MTAIALIDPTNDWLIAACEPVVHYRALVELLEVPPDDSCVTERLGNQVHTMTVAPA